ncbi:hypothetical protein AX17_003252 [Amanita inopinata Kibby_2008]|nr:hypothetical protein AX17_003252 [Amanita inopinata Kibby_2008]
MVANERTNRYRISSFFDINSIKYVIHLSFAMPTAIDIIIAGIICRLLSQSKTAFQQTNSRLWTVMRYVLISGTLTTACSLSALITYAVMPNNLVFLAIEFLLTKLYVNSYLAMLNARKSVRDRSASNAGGSNAIQLSDVEGRRPTDHNASFGSRSMGETQTGKYRGKIISPPLTEEQARNASPSPSLSPFFLLTKVLGNVQRALKIRVDIVHGEESEESPERVAPSYTQFANRSPSSGSIEKDPEFMAK